MKKKKILIIAYACMGREGGCCPKSTLAYSQGGRVKNSDFFAYENIFEHENNMIYITSVSSIVGMGRADSVLEIF